jgi:hypothetical protein
MPLDKSRGTTELGTSSLSGVVHTWVLARANRDRALELFQQVLKSSDVSDIQGGITSEGIHLAAMAGSVDLIQRCFTGLETRGDRIVLSPHWPETLGVLAFPIHYRGLHLHLRISGMGAIISVDPRDAHGVEVECRGRVIQLTAGSTPSDFPGDPRVGPAGPPGVANQHRSRARNMLHYWPIRQFGNATWGLNRRLGDPRATTDRDRHLDRTQLSPPATPSHPVPIGPIVYENIMTAPAYQTA